MASITGTPGNDLITPAGVSAGVTGGPPGPGNDTINGGAGNDTIDGGGGIDRIDSGGLGNDRWVLNVPALNGLTLAQSSDRVTYTVSNGTVARGFAYFDLTLGANSAVSLFVPIFAERAVSSVTVASGTLTLDWSGALDGSGANNAAQSVRFDGGTSQLNRFDPSGAQQVVLSGFSRADIRTGNSDDVVLGTAGADTIRTASGNDVITGNGGADSIDGGDNTDAFIAGDLSAFGPFDLVNTAGATALALGTSGIRIANIEALSLTTGAGDDRLVLAGGNDSIAAGLGRNLVSTGAGNDRVTTTGIDTLDAGTGTDSWTVLYGALDGLTFTQTAATSFTLSNGTAATGVEQYAVTLGAGSSVNLRSGGAPGLLNSVVVGGGSLLLDWSDKTGGSSVLVNAAGAAATLATIGLGNRGASGSDERLFLAGFTAAEIRTGAGDDSIGGSAGADTITTGEGNDTINGAGGADRIDAGGGTDTATLDLSAFGAVAFTLDATPGATSAFLGTTASVRGVEVLNLTTGAGDDVLVLGEGNDSIAAGLGRNRVTAGGGDDRITTTGIETVTGGAGNDTWLLRYAGQDGLTFTTGATLTVSNGTTAAGIERFDAVFGANTSVNLLPGAPLGQVNAITVASGRLTLDWSASSGGSALYVNQGVSTANRADPGSDAQVVLSGFTSASLRTGAGADTVFGTPGADTISTGAGDDSITGAGGADSIDGGPGTDVAVLDLSAFGATRFTLSATPGATSRFANISARVMNVEALDLTTGAGDDVLTLGAGDDSIAAGGGRNRVSGGAGDDMIVTTGIDTVSGGAGFDTWRVAYSDTPGLTLTRGAAGSYTVSNGTSATEVEAFDIRLGAGATVRLNGSGQAGSSNFLIVPDGRLELDWSGKTAGAFVNLGNGQAYGNIAESALDEVLGLYGFTSALFRGGSGGDTVRGLEGGGSTLFGGAGDDELTSFGAATIDGGTGIDTWRARRFLAEGVTLTQTSATGFTLSDGSTAAGIEVYDVSLGANATVLLRTGGAPGRFSSVDVGSGTLTLDWSAKSGGSFIQAGNNTSYGSYAGNFLTDEVLSTYGFTRAVLITGAGADYVYGTVGDDEIRSGAGDDVLVGLAGADTLRGGAGNDGYTLDSPGDLVLEAAGEGTDTVFAAFSLVLPDNVEALELFGADPLTGTGNAAANTITGNEGANLLLGGGGNDLLRGSAGAPGAIAAEDADTLRGEAGNDTLDGAAGADLLVGRAGNDTYYVDDPGDRVEEAPGEGTDLVIATIDYTLGAEVERLTLAGDTGLAGRGNALANLITGTAAGDTLAGGEGNDTLQGGDGRDSLAGEAGNDRLEGGAGADTLAGGPGNDTYVVDSLDDLVVEAAGEGSDLVIAAIDYTLGAEVERLTLAGTEGRQGLGNALANLLTGGAGADTLGGGAGNDTLMGGLGADRLEGGPGLDTFRFARPEEGGDSVIGYLAARDRIEVSAAGFGGGLVQGADLLASGRYAEGASGLATAAPGTGQFVFETGAARLWWDADGAGGAAAVLVATFPGLGGLGAGEIIVIA